MNKKSKEEKFAIAFANLYKTCLEMTELSIKMTLTQIECHEQIAKNHYKEEPSKIFKKKYKKWEEEQEKLDMDLFKLYEELSICLKDKENLLKN